MFFVFTCINKVTHSNTQYIHYSRALTYKTTSTHTHTPRHTHTYPHTHKPTHTHTYKHTHLHLNTHKHTHTHTQRPTLAHTQDTFGYLFIYNFPHWTFLHINRLNDSLHLNFFKGYLQRMKAHLIIPTQR